jgi:hypothetical protein
MCKNSFMQAHTHVRTHTSSACNPSASCASTLSFTPLMSPPIHPTTHTHPSNPTHPTQLPPRSCTHHSPAAGNWDGSPLATHCHQVHTRPDVSTTTMFTHAEARIRRQQAYAQSRPPIAQRGEHEIHRPRTNPPQPTNKPIRTHDPSQHCPSPAPCHDSGSHLGPALPGF